MKSISLRSFWLLSLLICGSLLLNSAVLAADGDVVGAVDAVGAVSPNQVSIAGVVGGDYERTLLVRLQPGVVIEGVVPGDLNSADGTSVLAAGSITASWPTPEPEAEPAAGDESVEANVVVADEATAPVEESVEVSADTEAAPSSDSAADSALDAETSAEAGADTDVIYPIPLTVAVKLYEVNSGQYTGEIFIVTSEGELPVTLNVSVKARGIWPMLVLLAGLALGIGMSTYRKRGRRRDELLVEAGTLRESMDADPELADDAVGAIFRTRIEAELLDAHVALRSADWETADQKLAAAQSIYVNWRSDRANWIVQLGQAAGLRKDFESEKNPFHDDLIAKVDQVVAAAPAQSDAGSLRDDLVAVARHKGEYDRADQLLVQLKQLINNLPAGTNEEKKVRAGYATKLADYAPQLSNLLPISDDGYSAKYDPLVAGAEADIKIVSDLLANGAPPRTATPKGALSASATTQVQSMATVIPPLNEPIDKKDADEADKRLRYFQVASYAVALILLGLAGYNELYVTKATFGANPWADYATLFAWGFGAEATRAAVTDLVRNWEVPFGDGG